MPFTGGPAEEALRTQRVQVVAPSPRQRRDGQRAATSWVVLAPVTERGEALGLLRLTLPDEPGAAVLSQIARIGHVLAFVVIANRRHTDLFEWAQRSTSFTLPAEIQRRLLPGGVHLRGRRLRPLGVAGTGGNHRRRHLRLQPGPRRPAPVDDRRDGPRRGQRPDRHLVRRQPAQHPPRRRLPARAGRTPRTWPCSSTRPPPRPRASPPACWAASTCAPARSRWSTPATSAPYLCRAGAVSAVALPVDLPMGMFADATYRSTDLVLQPGDRLVLVTDGMLERNAATAGPDRRDRPQSGPCTRARPPGA